MTQTEESIIDGNKLIAEFMGWKKKEVAIEWKSFWYPPDYIQKDALVELIERKRSDSFRFHTSWDLLMPVVEKIESLGHDVWFQSVHNRQLTQCTIWNVGGSNPSVLTISKDDSKIKAVFQAVINFIHHYNSNH